MFLIFLIKEYLQNIFKNSNLIWLYFKEQLGGPQILGGTVYANFVVNILIFLHGNGEIENLFTDKNK